MGARDEDIVRVNVQKLPTGAIRKFESSLLVPSYISGGYIKILFLKFRQDIINNSF